MHKVIAVLALSSPTGAFRVTRSSLERKQSQTTSACSCAQSSLVDGVETGHAGCDQHFGQRFGYVCYVQDGSECEGARLSSRLGVYWRSCAAEHHDAETRAYLQEAMDGIDVEAIQEQMRIAEGRGIDQESLDAAEARIQQIGRMSVVREELMVAIGGLDLERLRAVLEEAEELELDEFLDEETLEEAVERFEWLETRVNVEATLMAAVAAYDVNDLIAKLQDARAYQCSPESLQQGDDRVVELQHLMTDAANELTTAVTTRDVPRLRAAMEAAERLSAADDQTMRQAQYRVQHLLQMTAATNALLQAIEGDDLQNVEVLLSSATNLDASPDILAMGHKRVLELEAHRDSSLALEGAIHDSDSQALEKALTRARGLNATTEDQENRAAVRLEHLREVDQAANELIALFESDDSQALMLALARAREIGVAEDILEQGEQARHRIARIRHDVRKRLIELTESGTDADELEAQIAETNRLHAASPRRIEAAENKLATLRS